MARFQVFDLIIKTSEEPCDVIRSRKRCARLTGALTDARQHVTAIFLIIDQMNRSDLTERMSDGRVPIPRRQDEVRLKFADCLGLGCCRRPTSTASERPSFATSTHVLYPEISAHPAGDIPRESAISVAVQSSVTKREGPEAASDPGAAIKATAPLKNDRLPIPATTSRSLFRQRSNPARNSTAWWCCNRRRRSCLRDCSR